MVCEEYPKKAEMPVLIALKNGNRIRLKVEGHL